MKRIVLMCSMMLLGLFAFAAAPKCIIEKEFWGHQYLKLIDVNGIEYKLTIPTSGTSTKFKTRTGWYLINWKAEIVQYQDKVILQNANETKQIQKGLNK